MTAETAGGSGADVQARWTARLKRVPVTLALAWTIVFIVLLWAALPSLFTGYSGTEGVPGEQLRPPSAEHILGTDGLGRCVLSRLLHGASLALKVAFIAATGAMLLGAALAYAAGYLGGWVDWTIGRAVDVWMSFPPVVLSLILMVGLGTGASNVILAIILVDWTRFCRVLRSEVLVVTRRDHVAAARLLGFSHWRTLLLEVVPATIPLLITLLALEMGIAVVVEAILSFVGLGVKPDQVAWGQMIADGREAIYQAPANLLAPVAAIFVTVAGFNLLGDGLRRTLDVRLVEGRG